MHLEILQVPDCPNVPLLEFPYIRTFFRSPLPAIIVI